MRKSFFRFSLRSPTSPVQPEPTLPPVTDTDEVPIPLDSEARYIPLQFAPNRLQTIHVTPSEKDLYLRAMAQLDQAPPPLPLWSDSPPIIPAMTRQTPMDSTPPSIRSPRTMNFGVGGGSKLVTSPGMPIQGLSIREEFRSVPGAEVHRSGEHALLALSDDSQLRFHNFPVDVLISVEEALKTAWPRGRRSAHPDLEELKRKSSARQEGNTWIVVLKGKVWRQAGNSELDSIRLILALLTTLSVHGWILVDRMQAAGVKYDNHNLLFVHSPETQATPPTYFALSIPLPDRIALISPPPKATPSIISAVREAIDSQTASSKKKARRGGHKVGDRTSVVSSAGSKSVEWDAWKGNIRQEGWVHEGVYRFWLGGMRRWLGNGVKWRVVEKVHPGLILNLINLLSTHHFSLVASLPLLPLVKGRDVLIFASQPPSGLTYRDAWTPQSVPATNTDRMDSIVMVDPVDAMLPPGERMPDELRETAEASAARHEAEEAMMAERRQAAGVASPTSGASGQTSPVHPQGRMRNASAQSNTRSRDPSPTHPTRPTDMVSPTPQAQGRSSMDDGHPLIPANISSPRQRNLLFKRSSLKRGNEEKISHPPSRTTSLRRKEDTTLLSLGHQRFASLDGGRGSVQAGPGPRRVNITSRHGIGSDYSNVGTGGGGNDDGEWTMIESPRQKAGLGLSMYAPQNTATSEDVIDTSIPPRLPPRPTQPYVAPSPIEAHNDRSNHPSSYAPLNIPFDSPPKQSRPSIDSDRSIYVDAPSQAINNPPTSYDHHIDHSVAKSDTGTTETPYQRDLAITNPTPPPAHMQPFQPQYQPIPEIQQPTSPMLGRDAIVDVGNGFGAESVRGSVGYMGGGSQSFLGLNSVVSEGGPILGAWENARGGGEVPPPMPVQTKESEIRKGDEVHAHIVDGEADTRRKGKGRQGVRNMFGFKHGHAGKDGYDEAGEKVDGNREVAVVDGNAAGSSRTKMTIGA